MSTLLLFACGSQRNAGGGIWDQTENGVALIVIDSAGKPVANARVRLVSISVWPEEVLTDSSTNVDSAITDKDGRALLHTNSWPVNLEVESSLGVSRGSLYGADSAHQVKLQAPSQLSGTLANSEIQSVTEVRLAGSSYRASLSPQGAFNFAKIPAGAYSLVAIHPTRISLMASATTTQGDTSRVGTLVLPDSNTILLDDFEDGNDVNRYHALTGEGWWYTATDSISKVIPEEIGTGIVKSKDSWQGGQSLHESLAVNINVPGKYALCGMDIEAGVKSPNTTHIAHNILLLDSITFMAKGSGTIYLQLYSNFNAKTGDASRILAQFDLTSTWTQVSLKPSDFLPDVLDSSLTWQTIAAQATGFAFSATKPADLWLDNVELHGISESQLFPQLHKP